MKKIIASLMLIIVMMVALSGIVSAFDFDNVKTYNKELKEATINNCDVWLLTCLVEGDEIAKVKLDTPLVFNVIRGKDRKVAEFTINSYEDYEGAFKDMEFYDKKNNLKQIQRGFKYKYQISHMETVNDYKDVCEEVETESGMITSCNDVLVGTIEKEIFEWRAFNKNTILPKGEITIGIFTEVLPNENIEWIPTLFGVEIGEWAEWKESLNTDLLSYWRLDNNNASDELGANDGTINGTVNVTGKILSAQDFESSEIDNIIVDDGSGTIADITDGDLTINAWVKMETIAVSDGCIFGGSTNGFGFYQMGRTGGGYLAFGKLGINEVVSTDEVTAGTFYMVSMVYDATADTIQFYINGVADSGGTDAFSSTFTADLVYSLGRQSQGAGYIDAVIDEVSIWTRTLSSDEITYIYNSGVGMSYVGDFTDLNVTLNSPVDYYNSTISLVDFNCSTTDSTAVLNLTLIIDGVDNYTITNSSANENLTLETSLNMNDEDYNWTCRTTDGTGVLEPIEAVSRNLNVNTTPAINFTDPTPSDSTDLIVNYFTANVSLTETYFKNVTFELYSSTTLTSQTNTNATRIHTFTSIADDDYNLSVITCTTTNQCNRTENRTLNVNTTPAISFTDPTHDNATNISTQYIPVNVTLTETYFKNVTFNFYLNDVLNESITFTDSTRFYNKSESISGNWKVNATTWTTTDQFNSTETRTYTIDRTEPVINITSPNETINYHKKDTNISLNWTTSDAHQDSCWYNYAGTNTTITCSDNTTEINITSYTYKTITFYANDTFGNLANSIRSWNYKVFQTGESYTASTLEGSTDTFYLNFTKGSSLQTSSTKLIYNLTSYLGAFTSTSNNISTEKSLAIPSVSAITNATFYWSITMSDDSVINTTSNNQTINSLEIDNCSTYNKTLYNFTIYDEEFKTKIDGTALNSKGSIDIDIYSNDLTTLILNYSSNYNKTNPMDVCLNNNLSSGDFKYIIDTQVQYSADGYETELYHIQNTTINSSYFPTVIGLYDLNNSDSQEFKIVFKSSAFLPVENALIEIKRKYIDEGTFIIVELPKTDKNGETIAHLVLNDVIYNFRIIKYGTVLATFNNVLAVCQTPLVADCTIDFNAFLDTIDVPDFEENEDFSFTLGYNKTSRLISSVFSIPSGTPSTIILNITREDSLGTFICTDTLTSSSGTLSCTVPNSFGNSTVKAKLYKDGSEQAFGNFKLDQSSSDIYGGALVFLSLFIMLTLVGVGISDNPVYTLLFLMVGVVLLFALNLVENNGFVGASATILWIVVAIIIVIIKGGKRS